MWALGLLGRDSCVQIPRENRTPHAPRHNCSARSMSVVVEYVCECGRQQAGEELYWCRHCAETRCKHCVAHEVSSLIELDYLGHEGAQQSI